MKKTILIISVIFIALSIYAVDRDPLTISNHGPNVAYYWNAPNEYGDIEQGVQYTTPAACTLESWDILFYEIIGTPLSIVVHVYDDNAGEPGLELGSLTVSTTGLELYSDWTNIDLTSLELSFNAGDVFYITYTVTSGTSNVVEVQWLSDDGTYASTSKTFQGNGTTWLSMADGWNVPYEMFAKANIETLGVVDPIFNINFTSYNFGQTAIGGTKNDIFTVSNIGGGNIVVQGIDLTGNTDFSIYDPNEGTYPITLASSETMNFYVEYYPSRVGAVTSNVAVTIDDREVHDIRISGEGYVHISWADPGAIFDQSPSGMQGDNQWSMKTSDLTENYLHAEEFYSLVADIGSIDFWGINWYHDGTAWVPIETEDPMDFSIIFYDSDVDGLPGTALQTYTPTLTRSTVSDSLFSQSPVYKYHYDLPSPLSLTDGWVSIAGTSVGAPDDAWFLWSTSPLGDGYNADFKANLDPPAWDWDVDNLAFALFPITLLDPPTNVSVTMNGDIPELSWTDVPGIYNKIYRANTPNGVYSVVGIVTDGAGSFIDVTASGSNNFYYLTATNETPARKVIIHNERVIRRVPIQKYDTKRMMK